jgi:type III secretory pathway component EscV
MNDWYTDQIKSIEKQIADMMRDGVQDYDHGSLSLVSEQESTSCICSMERIMSSGCNCGAMDVEKDKLKRQIEKAERDNANDLSKGVGYGERKRRYGHLIKSV